MVYGTGQTVGDEKGPFAGKSTRSLLKAFALRAGSFASLGLRGWHHELVINTAIE
jgi:hypothetical protein